jgi:LacI family transcriptional regulator
MRITTSTCPSVGLLVDWLAHGYQDDVVEGVERAASQRGANLFVFVGGSFLNEALAEANNTAFAGARHPVVDGVVALSGTLVNPLGAGACERILESLDVPVVSVGVPIASGSTVGVDNHAGLTALCEHLVEAHQARHIAMIAGPEESHESEERIAACRETLALYDITLRESHVTRQGFWLEHGRQGVVELLDRRRLMPGQVDAIVCASDLLAEGALEELTARGLRVPEDVKLTGFDGIDRGRYLSAPLTTVQQPFVELGCAAARSLLQKLDGATVPDSGRQRHIRDLRFRRRGAPDARFRAAKAELEERVSQRTRSAREPARREVARPK